MISYKITYKDWAGNDKTETYRFHLNDAELTLLTAKYDGSLPQTMARLVEEHRIKEMMDVVVEIIKSAYGRMDDDMVHFRKSPEILDDWLSTEGFNRFFLTVTGDDREMSKFIRGVMPPKVQADMDRDSGTDGTDGAVIDLRSRAAALMTADVTVT